MTSVRRRAVLPLLIVGALLVGAAPAAADPRVTLDWQDCGEGTGLLGWLAVGCPVCNKLVVLLLGSSGALTYFAPVQPLLGVLAVTLSAAALGVRLRTFYAGCATRPAHA